MVTHKRDVDVIDIEADVPRSMVFKMGDSKRKPTAALSQLVHDFRALMQPHTAAKLKERKRNNLKDFFVMAGPLKVSHFFIFSQSANDNTILRMARGPRGPTLYFKVLEYSLAKDVQQSQKRPHALSTELRVPPALVMNGFSSANAKDQDTLVTTMFHSMLPPIDAETTKLSTIKRVMLINKDSETGIIDIRQYAVVTRVVGATRAIKKLLGAKRGEKPIPNLGNFSDAADYIVDPNLSESEGEDELFDQGPGGDAKAQAKRAVRLVEVGPRLRLQLFKVQEGLCEGKILYHAYQQRTKREEATLENELREKDALRAKRREEQEENVRRKRQKLTRNQRAKLRSEDAASQDAANSGEDSGPDLADPEDMNDYELEAELAHSD